MAEREGSSNAPWIAFLAGVVLVALVAFGYFATTNQAPREEASLEINMPDTPTPEIDLPAPPPVPALPPTADEAPVQPAN